MRKWLAVGGAVAAIGLVAALCFGDFSDKGPTYTEVAQDFCDLPYDLFEPTLGPIADEVQVLELDKGEAGCRIHFEHAPKISLTVWAYVHPGVDDAEHEYQRFFARARLGDVWSLDLPAKRSEWGYTRWTGSACIWDGNMTSVINFDGIFDTEMSVHFGEPLKVFGAALLTKLHHD